MEGPKETNLLSTPTGTESHTENSKMSNNQTPRPGKWSVLVLYASETGNAQEVAEELGDLTERLHFVTQVSEMNSFKPVRLNLLLDW